MALNANAVNKGHKLLLKIGATNSFIRLYNERVKPQPLNTVLGAKPHGGGYESIGMFVKDITEEQLRIFNEGKGGIPNSAICNPQGNGITLLGWY